MIKNLIIFLFVSLSFTKFLYADNSIEGLYSGNLIYPDGNRFPMVSEFKINENKGVWGNYRYIYEEKNYEGVFYKGKLTGFDLEIFWSDEFGEGWLEIKFDKSFNSFKGNWGAIENKKKLRKDGTWTGERL